MLVHCSTPSSSWHLLKFVVLSTECTLLFCCLLVGQSWSFSPSFCTHESLTQKFFRCVWCCFFFFLMGAHPEETRKNMERQNKKIILFDRLQTKCPSNMGLACSFRCFPWITWRALSRQSGLASAPRAAQGAEVVAAVNRVGTIPYARSAVGAAQLTWEWLCCWKFPL